jgi:hypothetical protein
LLLTVLPWARFARVHGAFGATPQVHTQTAINFMLCLNDFCHATFQNFFALTEHYPKNA